MPYLPQTPLLRAKFSAPSLRPNRVLRIHLLERLDEGTRLGQKLTLVCAPAGYGKTTLVSEWLLAAKTPHGGKAGGKPSIAWLSLDTADNDPARFLAYLIAALQQISSQIGANILAMLQAPQPPPVESMLGALIQEMDALPAALTLVLDDYHLIDSPAIHRQLNFLLEYQPARLHLVIVTRTDPPIPLHRLRARGQMNEIRQDDLRFATGEAVDFLRHMLGADLQASQVAVLVQHTEGWATGLQLAALAFQGWKTATGQTDIQAFLQTFSGNNRYILDYLFEEVFQQQSPQVQDFLVKTSILSQFCPALCDALLANGAPTAEFSTAEIIASLEHHNLFIISLGAASPEGAAAPDSTQTWFRYHHLFLDLLRHRLHLQTGIDEADLQRRASQWFAAHGYTTDALPHAIAGADWEGAASLIGQLSPSMMMRGEYTILLSWFRQLPEEFLHAHPRLCHDYSWPLILTGQLDAAEALSRRAEQAAEGDAAFLGRIYTTQAYLARTRGNIPQAIELSQKALAFLPPDAWVDRGNLSLNLGIGYWHAGRVNDAERLLNEARQAALQTGNRFSELTALVFISRTLAVRGKLGEAARLAQQAIRVGGEASILALAELDLSIFDYEHNDLAASEPHLQRSLLLSQRSGNLEFLVAGHLQQARLRLAQGKPDEAWKILQGSFEAAPIQAVAPHVQQRRAAACAEAALACGNIAEAETWHAQAGDQSDSHPFYRFLGLTQARLLLAQGNRQKAAEILAQRAESAKAANWEYGLVAVRALQALAAPTLQGAMEFLTAALHLGYDEKFIRTFADCGPTITPLLKQVAGRGVHPEYAGRILTALKGGAASPNSMAQSSLAEPLSGREIEILHFVAAGMSNRAIAEQLVLSLGTVKSHVHAICGKLGAASRTQAVAEARKLGLC